MKSVVRNRALYVERISESTFPSIMKNKKDKSERLRRLQGGNTHTHWQISTHAWRDARPALNYGKQCQAHKPFVCACVCVCHSPHLSEMMILRYNTSCWVEIIVSCRNSRQKSLLIVYRCRCAVNEINYQRAASVAHFLPVPSLGGIVNSSFILINALCS